MSTFSAQTTPIVWIDCEMTGLDIEHDDLVEIAVVVTDSELHPYNAGLNLVIKPSAQAVANMDSFVRTMHTRTGLIDKWDDGLTIPDAQKKVLAYVKRFVPEARKAQIGGNSIGMDKMFLSRDMPELIEHLHYRVIDVSTIKELAKRWYPRVYFAAPAKTGNHTALGDIYDSIDELRYYRKALFPDGDGPSSEEANSYAKEICENLTRTQAEEHAMQRARGDE
ncbi:oligoribonuclease [Trueperella sp. LYQ143]|uniref:oligoribonuclease n=1 Tax=unclassified Trueperella TaxID=2630174 RepID=UPI003983AE0C